LKVKISEISENKSLVYESGLPLTSGTNLSCDGRSTIIKVLKHSQFLSHRYTATSRWHSFETATATSKGPKRAGIL
jgi:hypothetical protein